MARRDHAPEPPPHGLAFPTGPDGTRSSTATGRAVLAAAARPADPALAGAIEAEREWRTRYPQHVRRLVEASVPDPDTAVAVARAGLDALHGTLEFHRHHETCTPREAMASADRSAFGSLTVSGTGGPSPTALAVPYRGRTLKGGELDEQLARWEEAGVVEPSHAAAVRAVAAHPEWLDLTDQRIALLGAAAELGPFRVLAGWRADLVAVDLPRPDVLGRLVATARAGNGSLTLPVRGPRPGNGDLDDATLARCGADLAADAPELAAWLADLDGPLVVGSYAYADGAQHVRVSAGMDLIASTVAAARPDTTLAWLLTPTDVYAVTADVAEQAMARYAGRRSSRLWQEPLRVVSGRRFFRPNYTELLPAAGGTRFGVTDCLVTQQGPNYALAKRLQQWRATTTRAGGGRVSANVAPATRTRSVVKSRALAAAYAGAHHFGVEIFEPATSEVLMAALLVHDLRAGGHAGDPAVALRHPLELFVEGANHGGLWRAAYAARSVMELAAVLGVF